MHFMACENIAINLEKLSINLLQSDTYYNYVLARKNTKLMY